MSNSVRPHRRQPTRLPRPWDSPGKNNGVGCHFLLQCMKVKSEREVTQSCPTLSDLMDCSLPGSSVHGIFQARVLEWGAIAFSDHILLKIFKEIVAFSSGYERAKMKLTTHSWQPSSHQSHYHTMEPEPGTPSHHLFISSTIPPHPSNPRMKRGVIWPDHITTSSSKTVGHCLQLMLIGKEQANLKY